MALQRVHNPQQNIFTAYGASYVAINDRRFDHAIVVTAGKIFTDWTAHDFASLEASHFDYFLVLVPEVLLFGTGGTQSFPHPQLYRNLITAGISIEFMDTPAACRTYNILAAEDRKVVAAVLL